MLDGIVHIESANKHNNSFGTGFVINNNKYGTYILTCQHVLDSVENACVESNSIEVIAHNNFLDMAIIFLPSIHHEKMSLQLEACESLNITSIAFSSFKKDLVQKSTIHATLFKDFIELHSTEDDTFYLIKKIKADTDYHFSRGNSGAPIICNKTGNVIAMLSNKEGTDIAYAIGVSSIKKLLEQLSANDDLMQKHKDFHLKMSSFKKEVNASVQIIKNPKNRAIYHMNELKRKKSTIIGLLKKKLINLKYFLLGGISIFALYGIYSIFNIEKVDTNAYYNIVNLPSHETLNVREGAGKGYKAIYELMPNADHIIVTRCKNNDEGTKWCHIKYKEIKGWVHSYYIEEDDSMHLH